MATIITNITTDATLQTVRQYTGYATFEAMASSSDALQDMIDTTVLGVVYMTRENIEALIMERTAEDDLYEDHFEENEFGVWVWVTFDEEGDRSETYGLTIEGSNFYRVEGAFIIAH